MDSRLRSADLKITRRNRYLAQPVWLSIGYALGASVGAGLALPEERPLLVIGDGGLQTVLSGLLDLVRLQIPAVVMVINNGLYGIEQFLIEPEYFRTGSTEPPLFFTPLGDWNYASIFTAAGGRAYRVANHAELENALAEVKQATTGPALIEVGIASRDLPPEDRASVEPAPSPPAPES